MGILKRVALTQVLLFGGLYLLSVAHFVALADGITERFAALARGPYLVTAVLAQLSVVPAYVVLGLVATSLAVPLLDWCGMQKSWLRFLGQVLLIDGCVLFLGLGPALRWGPGLVDTGARKLPAVDLYALYRWHVLDVLTGLLVAWAVFAVSRAGRRVGTLVLAVLLLVAVSAFRQSHPPGATEGGRPNVLIIAADSLRFDRLGIHGAHHADISPNIDAFAQTATDFTNMHVSTASTLESWTTYLSGQFPARHGIRSMYPSREEVRAVEANAYTVPRLLAAAGYDTFVSSDWVGNCFDLVDFGFTQRQVGSVQNFEALLREASFRAHPLIPLFFGALPSVLREGLAPGFGSLAAQARPDELVDRLFEDVDSSVRARRPFFGVLFLSPTHLPYNARYPFNLKYAKPDYAGPHRYQVEINAHELITTGFSPTLPPEVIEHIRGLYDGAVSDFDDTVGRVLAELEVRGLNANTVVIITTDHGEDLYDSGSTLGHGTNFFGGEQSTHIPFLMRRPGQTTAQKVEALIRSVDFAPTVLSLLSVDVPSTMDGVDWAPVIRGEQAPPALTAFAETCYLFFPKSQAMTGLTAEERAQVVELSGAADTLEVDPEFRHNLVLRPAWRQAVIAAKDRMLRNARWKLIEIPGKNRPIYRLYDMVEDPEQKHNLAGQGLAVESELVALLPPR